MLRVAKKATKDRSHPHHHYLLGMLAFAYVECGEGNFHLTLTYHLYFSSFIIYIYIYIYLYIYIYICIFISTLVEKAERLGREATQLADCQRDPWAHHAVAHCMEITGRIDDGIK